MYTRRIFPQALVIAFIITIAPFLFSSKGQCAQSSTGSTSSTLLNTLTSDENWFYYYIPGIIRPDEGTIELTLVPSKPASEFTASYDFAFLVIPGQEISGRTLMGLHIPPPSHGTTGWNFICRNENKSATVNYPKLEFEAGQPIRIACSWGSELRLFINGKLVASKPYSRLISPLPALFKVRRSTPFNTRSVRISSCALPEERLGADPQKEFTADPDTTLLVTDGLKRIETFQTAWHNRIKFADAMPVWDVTSQCYVTGQEVRYPLVGINRSTSTQSFKIAQVITPYPTGEPLKLDRTWDIPGDKAYHLLEIQPPDLKSPGFYTVKTTITDPSGNDTEWKSSLSICPAFPTGAKEGALARYLGNHHDFDFDVRIMEQVGIHTSRVDVFKWFLLEPIQGKFQWDEADAMVRQANQANHDLLGILCGPPHWAGEDPGETLKKQHPNTTRFERWKPRNVKDWENYIFQVASRYKGKVKYWEIWNEVDFHPPATPASFSGSTEDYNNLLKAAYQQIKKADPEAQVSMSGFSLNSVCDAAMPYDLLKMGAADHFDIFAMHAYNGVLFVDELRAALDQKKPGGKMWMTEHAWLTISNEKNRIYQEVVIVLNYIEKKFEKFYAFGFDELQFSHFTHSPTVDFHILGVLQGQLRQTSSFSGRLTFPGSEDYSLRHVLTRADGKLLTVLGSELAAHQVRIEGTIHSATDVWGRPIAFESKDGQTKIKIASLAYIVSDKPIKVLESEATEATPLYTNGDFEQVQGDILTGGLSAGKPVGWTLRDKTYDPQGTITITDNAHGGKYSINIHSSGKGAVYAFQYCTIPAPGTYRVTGWFKRGSAKDNGSPFLSVYDMSSGRVDRKHFPQANAEQWTEFSHEVKFESVPEKQVAFMAGIEKGAGDLLVDDMTFTRIEPLRVAKDKVKPISLSSAANRSFTDTLQMSKKMDTVSLTPLRDLVRGSNIIGGVPFTLQPEATGNATVVVAPNNTVKTIPADSAPIPVNARFARLAFLHTAVYVEAQDKALLGEYQLTYEDGSTATIPLLNNRDLRDWFLFGNKTGIPAQRIITSQAGIELGAFVLLTDNPQPQKTIRHILLKSKGAGILILLAIAGIESAA